MANMHIDSTPGSAIEIPHNGFLFFASHIRQTMVPFGDVPAAGCGGMGLLALCRTSLDLSILGGLLLLLLLLPISVVGRSLSFPSLLNPSNSGTQGLQEGLQFLVWARRQVNQRVCNPGDPCD